MNKQRYNRKRRNPGRALNRGGYAEPSTEQCARKAYGVAKAIGPRVGALLSLLNVEEKYKDILYGGTSITDSLGIQTTLTSLSQGLTATTRTGQSVKFTHLSILGYIYLGAVSATSFVRLLIVSDRDPNGAAFAVTDLFSSPATGTDYTTAHRNVGNLKRFNVMESRNIALASSTLQTVSIGIELPLQFHTLYNTGNVGTVADIQSGGLYMILQSNQSVNYPTFTGTTRISFVDN